MGRGDAARTTLRIGPNHLGWILWIVLPGALVPAALIWGYGIKQSRAVLEQVST